MIDSQTLSRLLQLQNDAVEALKAASGAFDDALVAIRRANQAQSAAIDATQAQIRIALAELKGREH